MSEPTVTLTREALRDDFYSLLRAERSRSRIAAVRELQPRDARLIKSFCLQLNYLCEQTFGEEIVFILADSACAESASEAPSDEDEIAILLRIFDSLVRITISCGFGHEVESIVARGFSTVSGPVDSGAMLTAISFFVVTLLQDGALFRDQRVLLHRIVRSQKSRQTAGASDETSGRSGMALRILVQLRQKEYLVTVELPSSIALRMSHYAKLRFPPRATTVYLREPVIPVSVSATVVIPSLMELLHLRPGALLAPVELQLKARNQAKDSKRMHERGSNSGFPLNVVSRPQTDELILKVDI